jgi:hypothetical protein
LDNCNSGQVSCVSHSLVGRGAEIHFELSRAVSGSEDCRIQASRCGSETYLLINLGDGMLSAVLERHFESVLSADSRIARMRDGDVLVELIVWIGECRV